MCKWLVLGSLVGAAVGLLGSSIDILVWTSMGRPAVLVRQGWQSVHLATTIFCGLVAGVVYGTVLGGFINVERARRNAVFVFPLTFLVAIGVYVACAVATVKVMHIAPWLCGHALVFVVALVAAYVGLNSSGEQREAPPQ